MKIIYTKKYSDLQFIHAGLWAYNQEFIPELPAVKLPENDRLEGFLLMDEKNDEKAGGMVFTEDPAGKVIHLRYFWIKSAFRGGGYGKILLRHLKDELIKRDLEKIMLYTSDFQAPFFYPACGFISTGKYPACGRPDIFDFHYKWVNMKKYFADNGITLILASNSPRRRTLLAEYPVPFQSVIGDAGEKVFPGDGEKTAKSNAYAKAEKVFAMLREKGDNGGKNCIVLGADTVIESEGRVLGKPSDTAEAEKMLLSLAGKTHKVITGIALISEHKETVFAESTFVTFLPLTPEDVRSYMEKVFVLDKAGAYAAQEHGEMILEKIDGSMDNVVGLPVARVVEELLGKW